MVHSRLDRVDDHRAYLPVSSPSARTCPSTALSTVATGRARLQLEHGVQREEPEEVAMRSARRAGTAVADLAEVVLALAGPWRPLPASAGRPGRSAFASDVDLGRQVEEDPVRPGSRGASGSSQIKASERAARRNAGPFQRRRPVRAVAGVRLGDHAPVGERRAGQTDRHAARILGREAEPSAPQPGPPREQADEGQITAAPTRQGNAMSSTSSGSSSIEPIGASMVRLTALILSRRDAADFTIQLWHRIQDMTLVRA